MKKILLLSVLSLLLMPVLFVQAEDLARYGEGSGSDSMQAGDAEPQMQMQQNRMLQDESVGLRIQQHIHERINMMQERKSQLRKQLQEKASLEQKKQLMQQYRQNEVSDFVQNVKNRVQEQAGRFADIKKSAIEVGEKLNNKMKGLVDEEKKEQALNLKEELLNSHNNISEYVGELTEYRQELVELKEAEEWDEFKTVLSEYKGFLQNMKDELQEAVSSLQNFNSLVE